MKLTRRLVLHARMQGGALYRYDVLLGDEVVGTVTTTINKKVKPWSETVTYQANGRPSTASPSSRPRSAKGGPTMSNYFPDQPVVKGADVIYRPAGQAGEYAPLATNPYRGCGHKCAYCYVPLATKIDRKEFDQGAVPRPNFIKRLGKDCSRYREQVGTDHQIMLSFSTDPYHPGDTSLTRETLKLLSFHGFGFCTLTKGGSRALRDIDLFRPDRDAFAVTLTSLDDDFARKWERDAAPPMDRVGALRRFKKAGIFTWVSLEPTLDVESSLDLVGATREFVDLYKIGKASYLKEITRTTDWHGYTLRMIDLCSKLGVKHYIKMDLQPFLPDGYDNPLRVAQHH